MPSVWATVMRVLMVSMFFCFISAMPELAVSSVNLARAWTYASLSNCDGNKRDEAAHQKRCRLREHTLFIQFRQRYLYREDARYPDGAADAFETQRGHLSVVTVLKAHAESSQEGGPRQLRNSRGGTSRPV